MSQYQVAFEPVVIEIEADCLEEAVDLAYEDIRGIRPYVESVTEIAELYSNEAHRARLQGGN